MTDYSELVKALRERARREDEYYEHGGDVINDAAAAIESLQALLKEADKKQAYQHDYICELVAEVEELKASQPHWVSVEERYPDKAGRYLVYGDTYFTPDHNGDIDHYKNIEIGCWNDYAPKIVGNTIITHWMFLPEPPKEGEHGN